jgi:hypothetical protein
MEDEYGSHDWVLMPTSSCSEETVYINQAFRDSGLVGEEVKIILSHDSPHGAHEDEEDQCLLGLLQEKEFNDVLAASRRKALFIGDKSLEQWIMQRGGLDGEVWLSAGKLLKPKSVSTTADDVKRVSF